MIYDLDGLSKEVALSANTQYKLLLAIAERLEALVEAQKPTLVEFESYGDDYKSRWAINPREVVDVWEGKDGIGASYVAIRTTKHSIDKEEFYPVKGTLAEVMAKLRGEATNERD